MTEGHDPADGVHAHTTRTVDFGVSFGDLPRAVGGFRTQTASECHCRCEASRACVAWTYHGTSSLCYLKGGVVQVRGVEVVVERAGGVRPSVRPHAGQPR